MPPLSTFLIVGAAGALLILIGILLKGKFRGLFVLWGVLLLGTVLILVTFYAVCMPFLKVLRK